MEALEAAAGEVPKEEIEALFKAQREAFHTELPVSFDSRMDRINRPAQMILDNKDPLWKSLSNALFHGPTVQT